MNHQLYPKLFNILHGEMSFKRNSVYLDETKHGPSFLHLMLKTLSDANGFIELSTSLVVPLTD